MNCKTNDYQPEKCVHCEEQQSITGCEQMECKECKIYWIEECKIYWEIIKSDYLLQKNSNLNLVLNRRPLSTKNGSKTPKEVDFLSSEKSY